MSHMDPASPEFEQLSPQEQARIYRTVFGWKLICIADEFGVAKSTVSRWLDPDVAERQKLNKRASSARARERYRELKANRPDRRNLQTAERSDTPILCSKCEAVHYPRLTDLKKKSRVCIKCQRVWAHDYYARQRAGMSA